MNNINNQPVIINNIGLVLLFFDDDKYQILGYYNEHQIKRPINFWPFLGQVLYLVYLPFSKIFTKKYQEKKSKQIIQLFDEQIGTVYTNLETYCKKSNFDFFLIWIFLLFGF